MLPARTYERKSQILSLQENNLMGLQAINFVKIGNHMVK